MAQQLSMAERGRALVAILDLFAVLHGEPDGLTTGARVASRHLRAGRPDEAVRALRRSTRSYCADWAIEDALGVRVTPT